MSLLAHFPSLQVEIGAVFVLFAALLARALSRTAGIPSIVSPLACGLAAGPTGLGLLQLDLTQPATRALLSLAVVVVLFEVTLRVNLQHIPKATIALLAVIGTGLVLFIVPMIARINHLTPLVATMIASICVVTGPTVIGPLMARLRPRAWVGHLLETEGLVLDALGVIIAAVTFASFTSRPTGPLDAAWQAASHVAIGLGIGIACGVAGMFALRFVTRTSSDISKIFVLLLAFGTYSLAEFASHESGLVAVVACGLLMDFRSLPHERLLRSFKVDLSMLALSTVFVLLASQIRLATMGPLLVPAAAIVAALILIRIVTVALATFRGPVKWRERILMMTVFPRGIVAVSLATYYGTQLPAWGLRGGDVLVGTLFLVVIMTIVISTVAALIITRALRLQMPSLVIAGISTSTLNTARRFMDRGHLPLLVDTDDAAVAFARSHDMDAEYAEDAAAVAAVARERKARFLIIESRERWRGIETQRMADGVIVVDAGSSEEARLLEDSVN